MNGNTIFVAASMAQMIAFSLPIQANAHPHVFAEAQLRVILSADQSSITSLQHLWRFDEIFSSTVMMEFEES